MYVFIVSTAFLISSATVIVRAEGVLCFVPVLHGCVWYVCCYVSKKARLQCLCNYREEGYGRI